MIGNHRLGYIREFQRKTLGAIRFHQHNIRIGRLDKKTNDVHDLDGNFLCNLGPVKGNKTSDKNNKAEKEDTVKTDTKEDVKSKEKNDKMSTETLIIIIAVSVTAVILIAVIAVAVLLLKKKSPKAK